MSFESSNNHSNRSLLDISNDQQLEQELEREREKQNQTQEQIDLAPVPLSLSGMLHNKELLTCYKCKEVFDPEKEDENEHSLDSNNILLGIIINKKTPSSICLKCLSLKMMELITEQFTKTSKDYSGLFFNYEQKFKS